MTTITLTQFETIDGLMAGLIAMGDFEACADPRAWIAKSNRLFDACVDAIGFEAASAFADATACAADITTAALLSGDLVVDINTCDCGCEIAPDAMLCGMCAAEYRAELACMDA